MGQTLILPHRVHNECKEYNQATIILLWSCQYFYENMFGNLLPRNWIICGSIVIFLYIFFSLVEYADKIYSEIDKNRDCDQYIICLSVC